MLKTESAEQSTTISGDKINSLPVNFGIGAGAIRNPLSFVQLTPGANIGSWNSVTVNGMPSVFLQDHLRRSGVEQRPGRESLRRIAAFSGSNSGVYAANLEFRGRVRPGVGRPLQFHVAQRHKPVHGSAYTLTLPNEALNAGIPFTNTGKNGPHLRPARNSNDYGFSVGGPFWLPKIYQGKNRTFFYFNLERYRDGRAFTTASTPCRQTRCAAAT